jgi:hypothetical protein
MISEIDARASLQKTLPPALSIPQKDGSDFHSLLKEKIQESAPLERISLEFLKKAVIMALWEVKPEETDLFLPSPFLLPLKPPATPKKPSRPQEVEVQPSLFEIGAALGVSNYLAAGQDFESIIQEAGVSCGVDPSLIKAVIQAESGGYPLAISKAGARGLMQLMPETAAELGVSNPFDPRENIMGGTRYLRKLLDRYRGDVKLALAAYNWGMGNLEKYPEALPRETKNFIATVEKHQRNFKKA